MTPELVFSLELKQTMENKPLSAMTVEDVFEFVSTKLCLPDLAQKFKGNFVTSCLGLSLRRVINLLVFLDVQN